MASKTSSLSSSCEPPEAGGNPFGLSDVQRIICHLGLGWMAIKGSFNSRKGEQCDMAGWTCHTGRLAQHSDSRSDVYQGSLVGEVMCVNTRGCMECLGLKRLARGVGQPASALLPQRRNEMSNVNGLV